MHLYFERNPNAKCDCNILSLSWMGKLPDELQEDESWKLYRRKYYQEGWLATGNARGLVGVTFTTSHCRAKAQELPLRANYNLRGHRSEVILVKWNEPYQKLASCDSTGVIFVWIKYDGRWSIELINDRSTPVTYFSWSHDGRMALICYRDGFVLVGSVAGQRYWSSMLNHKAVITCGIWTPDDQQVYFGTTAGQLIVMDVHGAMVSEVQLGAGVTSMSWSAEKFKLEEDEDDENNDEDDRDDDDRDDDEDQLPPPPEPSNHPQQQQQQSQDSTASNGNSTANDPRNYVLAVCLADGNVVLLHSFDDVSPVTIRTGLRPPLQAEWSNSRKILAVAGIKEQEPLNNCHNNNCYEYTNLLKFYSDTGVLIYTIVIPYTQSPVTAMTWGHNDRRLFVATGAHVHAAWVSRGVGSLQLLSRLALKAALTKESSVQQLPLPLRLKTLVSGLFSSTIRCCIPETRELRRFVSRPPPLGGRLHCTMLRNAGEPPHSYTLYVEYLGGLVPLLKGRRISKIRPEFVIFDPENGSSVNGANGAETTSSSGAGNSATTPVAYYRVSCSDDSDSDRDAAVDLCGGSPRFRRKNRRKCRSAYERSAASAHCHEDDETNYVDTLPENARLVEVTSNIWGTKFKFHGLADSMPANLGRVTYRPSLLHLQPRQMTLVITELRDDLPAGPDPNFNPNLFSEDEEDSINQSDASPAQSSARIISSGPLRCMNALVDQHRPQSPPIAPMTPRVARSRPKQQPPPPPPAHQVAQPRPPQLQVAESRAMASEDDYPYDQHPLLNYNGPGGAYHHHHHHHHHRSTYAPRCCDVPALQSPKNAVAPTQTLIATASPSPATIGEYASGVQRMKSALADYQPGALTKKELDMSNAGQAASPTSKLQQQHYSHVSEDSKYVASNGSTGSCLHQSTQPPTPPHLNSAYANAPAGLNDCATAPLQYGIPLSAKANNGPVLRRELAKEAARSDPTDASDVNVSGAEGEESKNELPALKSQYQLHAPTVVSINPTQVSSNSIVRSCSVGYLDLVDAQIVPCEMALNMLRRDAPNKRLFLVSRKNKLRRPNNKDQSLSDAADAGANVSVVVTHRRTRQRLSDCGKSRSLDSSELFPCNEQMIQVPPRLTEETTVGGNGNSDEPADNEINGGNANETSRCVACPMQTVSTEVAENELNVRKEEVMSEELQARRLEQQRKNAKIPTNIDLNSCLSPVKGFNGNASTTSSLECLTSRLDNLAVKLGDYEDCRSLPPPSPRPTSRLPRSSPNSPTPSKKGKRPASASPIRRRLLSSPLLGRKSRKNRNESSDEEDIGNYRDLETFQKAQMRQKLRQRAGQYASESDATKREIIMHNKAPMWNEANQVYQLDFGGRVTQESAKNFQIEFRGNQVMQFGRIQGNAYTLDFQYPFSAIQAFAVALASVTQRLK
ncbi:tubby-related protein 4 [Trichogramma pretiosum]|uniref:tubby-related protein 4 n=1 Tax=Trichogramma pretiosum TaxID=7493 RepID=UPI0006C9BE9F|nr:tubby-related protein 4 [Trichogramma pretiosum]